VSDHPGRNNWVRNDEETGYFTTAVCREYAEMLRGKHTLLVSDIRLNNTEAQIREDNRWQSEWVDALRPSHAQLKFRLPFDGGGKPYRFLDGKAYLQMFAPVSSTECRLVVTPAASSSSSSSSSSTLDEREYDVGAHEDAMYYFNREVRCTDHGSLLLRSAGGPGPGPMPELLSEYTDGCYDCVAMYRLLHEYVTAYHDNEVVVAALQRWPALKETPTYALAMTLFHEPHLHAGKRLKESHVDVTNGLYRDMEKLDELYRPTHKRSTHADEKRRTHADEKRRVASIRSSIRSSDTRANATRCHAVGKNKTLLHKTLPPHDKKDKRGKGRKVSFEDIPKTNI
jgi:hypothetical protein